VSASGTTEWTAAWLKACNALKAARLAIGELERLTEDGDADMKLCFAANSTHGAEALLREADQAHRQLALSTVGH
jgi:hypothetical protein